ncbi:O-antigen ligase family protein [Burkholderiaceae bacterium DAT-1]|nr:O-antigen ligase family protein [Burkholderiaceae bacterium DAT-1]
MLMFAFGIHTRLTDLGIELKLGEYNLISIIFQLGVAIYSIRLAYFRKATPELRKHYSIVNFAYFLIALSIFNATKPLTTISAIFFAWSLMTLGTAIGEENPQQITTGLDILFKISMVYLLIAFPISSELVTFHDPSDRESIFGGDSLTAIFPHKLSAGAFYSLMTLRYLILKDTPFRKRILSAVISYLMVLASDAATFIILTPFVYSVTQNIAKGGSIKKTLFNLSLSLFVLLPSLAIILPLFGRDLNFTGRTPLWEIGLDIFRNHFFIGYGFQSFFTENLNTLPEEFWRATSGLFLPTFESAYIQMLVETGISGVMAMIIIITSTINCLSKISNLRHSEPLLPLVFSLWLLQVISSVVLIGWMLPLSFWTLLNGVIFGMSCQKRQTHQRNEEHPPIEQKY